MKRDEEIRIDFGFLWPEKFWSWIKEPIEMLKQRKKHPHINAFIAGIYSILIIIVGFVIMILGVVLIVKVFWPFLIWIITKLFSVFIVQVLIVVIALSFSIYIMGAILLSADLSFSFGGTDVKPQHKQQTKGRNKEKKRK